MIQQFLDGLARDAHDLFLIVALLVIVLAFFIAGMGVLRLLEFLFPSLGRWLDTHLEPSIWDES